MTRVLSFDFETSLIRPGVQTPPAVCMSWADLCPQTGNLTSVNLLSAHDCLPWLWSVLHEPDTLIVGAETAFDVLVSCTTAGLHGGELLGAWIKAYEADRVTDVLLRQKLLDLAAGCYRREQLANGAWIEHRYALDDVAWRLCRMRLNKDSPWRLRYAELQDVPLDQWPLDARQYALDDAAATACAWYRQEQVPDARVARNFPERCAQVGLRQAALGDEYRQARAALWLKAMSGYGLRTDPQAVQRYAARIREEHDRVCLELVACGLMRGQRHRVGPMTLHRNTKAAAARLHAAYQAMGRTTPRTKGAEKAQAAAQAKGLDPTLCGVALDKEACQATDDGMLHLYAEVSHLGKVLGTDVPILELGATLPIHTRYEPLLETGRTSSSKPNVQNQPRGRKGDAFGTRECFVPRPGYVYLSADFSQLELYCLAQAQLWLLGYEGALGALLRGTVDGKRYDVHSALAADFLTLPYADAVALKESGDKAFDDVRNAMKAVGFGGPGGLGAATMTSYAWKSYGVRRTEPEWRQILANWKRSRPEMPDYFRLVASWDRGDGKHAVLQPYSGRLRADATYCSACNSVYQGLGSEVAKEAGWLLFKACYLGIRPAGPDGQHLPGTSPLLGGRPVLFVHDDFHVEYPENGQEHDAAQELALCMNTAGRTVLPDYPVTAEPTIGRRWSKATKPVLVEGRLTAFVHPEFSQASI